MIINKNDRVQNRAIILPELCGCRDTDGAKKAWNLFVKN
jgi:hypothetical protein